MNSDYTDSATDSTDAAVPIPGAVPADPAILQANLVALREQYLRLVADFENFRKRTRRDAEQQAATEKETFILELLPVLDNLERSLAAEPAHQAVKLVLRQLAQLLGRHGIEAVDAVGRPFDPRRHEAVFLRHDPAQPDHIVLEVLQRGYCRCDQLFRPAKVIVNDLNRIRGVGDAR